jgi:biopolymer transport protein ExbB
MSNLFARRSLLIVLVLGLLSSAAFAADKDKKSKKPPPDKKAIEQAERKAAEELERKDAEAPPSDTAATTVLMPEIPTAPNLLTLWFKGGPLMYPITLMSLLVGIFTIERAIGLRRRRVIPPKLVKGLHHLAERPGGLDPRQAYQLCQQYPSTTASVLKSVLLKVGRPQSEIDHAFSESCEREAAKLYKNVRTINLATTISPLLGLLGTVQGMIECFFITAHLPVGADKSENLANGIYIALVTTFGGLLVAIPASVFAHYFEGRIQYLFREIDELLLHLLPQLERFEGKMRMTRQPAEARTSSLAVAPQE